MRLFIELLCLCVSFSVYSLTLDEQKIIQQASEGAPAYITEDASFMMFKADKFHLIQKGNNNFTCLVVTNPQGRYEPSCFNQQAMRSVFPAYEMEMRLLYQGVLFEDVMAKIGKAFQKQVLPRAEHGALVYMMSPNNKYFSHKHGKLGDSPIHQMYFYPKLADEVFSLAQGSPYLWQGFPHLTALIVVVTNY